MEKFKEFVTKLFNSDIKSYWAWLAGGVGALIGSKLEISVKPKQKKEVKNEQKKSLIDKLREVVKEETKEIKK